MIKTFSKVKKLNGELRLPGDKSISHRSVMFSSLAGGISRIKNCSNAEDVLTTISIFKCMGVGFQNKDDEMVVQGKGFMNLNKPLGELYAGNSGTTARLMCGILSAQNFETVLTGDQSLSQRPMGRIVEPLKEMGADISANINGNMPVIIKPSAKFHNIHYTMKVASAQVKSAILLAGMHLEQESVITEYIPTRNHTEKLLGLRTEKIENGVRILVSKSNYPKPFELTVPSDISTAAFFMVFAILLENSEITIKNVSLNDTRTGILEILKRMGGQIKIENEIIEMGERKGDLIICSSNLKNIEIEQEIIPNIIDEIPILSIAGIFAEGNFRINGAKELRVKESDRIKAICTNLSKAGFDVKEYEDGFEISGRLNNIPVTFESFGDHRIAMAFSILAMIMGNGSSVNDFECVGISNPDFMKQIKSLT